MWILFQLAALTAVAATQRDCSRGACYPPMGDLLLGRDRQLHASSTCGLAGSEVFCTYFGQWRMKCCTCDSRNPSSQLAHTIQNVLSTAGPNRWWQARKDVNPVTLQLDLQNLFQLDTIILTFKGPHPNALVVERTLDNGQTWQPSHYMASDCRSAFPGIAMTTPRSLDQTYCYTLPPVPANSFQDQTFSSISVPNGQKIEEVSGLTGLRVKFTELGAMPRLPGRTPSLFYALREMRVMGTCLCHGHANRCLQDTTANQPPSTQVSAQCECQHNTAGVNCERCADLYNDLPWRSAEEGNTHTCKRCECNNHAQRCRFDPSVYEASGWRSGGVCEGCLHHTTGPKCDRCAPGYQPNHLSSIDQPDACTRCHCSAEGAENGGRCDDVTGSCRCKMGYYGLTASNPLGCTKCLCSAEGSLSSVCDPVSGQCPCRPYHQGLTCELCSRGYWNPSSPRGCEPCRCDPTNSHGDTCDRSTGQCQCRSGFGGRTCTECPDNTYGDPLIGCRPCQCAAGGMVPGGCDKRTGACRCRIGVIGIRCDACSRGHVYSFPDCEVCPSCFFSLDSYIQNLTLGLERLSTRIPSRPGGSLPTGLGLRIQALEATLIQIRDSLPLPTPSTRQVNDLTYGALSSIKNAYDESTDAAKSVEASGKTVDQSSAVREDSLDLQNQVQPANTRDLEKLNQQLNTKPDLSPTAKQVCGSVRSAPCTPAQCDGELCPAEGAPPCGRGESCVGALPLGTRAVRDAEEVKDRLQQLNGKITQAAAQVGSTDDLVNQMRQARDDLEADLRETRYFVKELKDFLSDPTDISTVSEWILNAKLPLSLAALKRKLQDIRALAAGLPDSKAVLDQAGPQLDTARRLLQEAQDALGEASALAEGMKPQLEGLKALVRSGGLLAQNAKGEANKANKEADAATRVSVC
uniref:Laminin subunit beta-3-like n=1 Tax=Salmo trutta TaxID=8032 RepID=A0A674E3Z8_SALTR